MERLYEVARDRRLPEPKGLDDNYISRYERGINEPSPHHVHLMCAKDAPAILKAALADTPPSLASQRSAILINLGAWYVQAKQIEEACAAIAESLTLARNAGLVMSEHRARGVRRSMGPWRSTSAVKALDKLLQAFDEDEGER